jgi:hypothetical protein
MGTFKIDFLVIGTQKGGTTALDYYLRRHPGIEMGRKKELHFFDNEKIFANATVDYSILEKQFSISPGKIYGDVTPIYMYWEPAIRRIWQYNSKIKLIAILRNPIDRAFSQWKMAYQLNNEKELFSYCIKNERERARQALQLQHRICSYIDRGFYAEQIKRIKRFFPDEQVLLIKYDHFVDNQEFIIGKILNFLSLDGSEYIFEHKTAHKFYAEHVISDEEKNYLRNIYINDIKEVERLLKWDCSNWLS